MARSKAKSREKIKTEGDSIVIDESKGLVFATEDELYQHFSREIQYLENEFYAHRSKSDIPEEEFDRYDRNLSLVLDDPDEVWMDQESLEGVTLFNYVREFESKKPDQSLYHVAVAYLTKDIPSFVYIHFPSRDEDLVESYRRGEKVFDQAEQNLPKGALEGDALSESDELAVGLYEAMLKLRQKGDILEDRFRQYAHLREETIEDADEIWRTNDSMGNVLVNFIKDYSADAEKDLSYLVVTVEDTPSNSHALLFSFPTNDKGLVDRYRQGENLQAEEVVQESSH